jgi:hypothetical protein
MDLAHSGSRSTVSLEIAAWAAACATFLAALVALLKEDLVSVWRRPRLNVRISLAPPDCHKTEFTLGSARTGEFLGSWPCYYLRVWVENVGNIRAKYVEVFASRLLRKLTLTGKWFDDEAKMFTDGVGFRRAKV